MFISSGVIIPIKVVPHLFFGGQLPTKQNVAIEGALPDHYTFYNISEFTERKNLKELIECFCQSFTKEDKVQLIIKTHYKGYNAESITYCQTEVKKILDLYPNHANIVVIYDNLTENQILALHAYGDCYITLARSEGFGLTVFDAYNYKKQIIATGYSGYLDFLGPDYPGLINYKLIPVNHMNGYNNYYTHDHQMWAQPDLDDVKIKMRKQTKSNKMFEFVKTRILKNMPTGMIVSQYFPKYDIGHWEHKSYDSQTNIRDTLKSKWCSTVINLFVFSQDTTSDSIITFIDSNLYEKQGKNSYLIYCMAIPHPLENSIDEFMKTKRKFISDTYSNKFIVDGYVVYVNDFVKNLLKYD